MGPKETIYLVDLVDIMISKGQPYSVILLNTQAPVRVLKNTHSSYKPCLYDVDEMKFALFINKLLLLILAYNYSLYSFCCFN